jgi:hypothetical protein
MVQHPIPREACTHISILCCQSFIRKLVQGLIGGNFTDRRPYFGKRTADRMGQGGAEALEIARCHKCQHHHRHTGQISRIE